MLFRFIAIAALIALGWWLLTRIAPNLTRNPRTRLVLAGLGLGLLRNWFARGGAGTLMRLIRGLRFFR